MGKRIAAIIWALMLLTVLLVGCNFGKDDEESPTPQPAQQTEQQQYSVSIEDVRELARTNFGDFLCEEYVSGSVYTVNLKIDGTAEAIYNYGYIDGWDEMRDALMSATEITYQESGYTAQYNIVNDQNPDYILLSVVNGEVVYDVTEE